MFEFARRGLADIAAALHLKGLWWALASEDVLDSHRRTALGPLWPLLNYLLFVGTLVLILGNGAGPLNFTAYVASGMLVWQFINETLSMSASLFTREQSLIKGTVLPISIYVLRQTLLVSIRSFYALLGAVPVLLFSGVEFTPAALVGRPGGSSAAVDSAGCRRAVRACRSVLPRFPVYRHQRHAGSNVHHAGLLDP